MLSSPTLKQRKKRQARAKTAANGQSQKRPTAAPPCCKIRGRSDRKLPIPESPALWTDRRSAVHSQSIGFEPFVQDSVSEPPGSTRGMLNPRGGTWAAQVIRWHLKQGGGGVIPLPDGGTVRTAASVPERSEDRNGAAERSAKNSPILIHDAKSVAEVTIDDRVRTYETRKTQALQFAQFLKVHTSEFARDRAERLEECGTFLLFNHYFTHPDKPFKLAAGHFCQSRFLCSLCAARMAAVTMSKAVPKVMAALKDSPSSRPAMLTLTCKNRESLSDSASELLGAFSKVMQRRRNSGKVKRLRSSAFSQIEGGILSCETKRGKNSGQWHFHAHAVVLLPEEILVGGEPESSFYFKPRPEYAGDKPLPEGSLAEEWSNALGYRANLDLQMLRSNVRLDLLEYSKSLEEIKPFITAELMEVFKYALKMADLSPVDHWSAFLQLKGRRLVRSFGSLYGIKEVEEFTDDLSEFEGLPFEELLFRFLGSKYRKVDRSKRVQAFDDWNNS